MDRFLPFHTLNTAPAPTADADAWFKSLLILLSQKRVPSSALLQIINNPELLDSIHKSTKLIDAFRRVCLEMITSVHISNLDELFSVMEWLSSFGTRCECVTLFVARQCARVLDRHVSLASGITLAIEKDAQKLGIIRALIDYVHLSLMGQMTSPDLTMLVLKLIDIQSSMDMLTRLGSESACALFSIYCADSKIRIQELKRDGKKIKFEAFQFEHWMVHCLKLDCSPLQLAGLLTDFHQAITLFSGLNYQPSTELLHLPQAALGRVIGAEKDEMTIEQKWHVLDLVYDLSPTLVIDHEDTVPLTSWAFMLASPSLAPSCPSVILKILSTWAQTGLLLEFVQQLMIDPLSNATFENSGGEFWMLDRKFLIRLRYAICHPSSHMTHSQRAQITELLLKTLHQWVSMPNSDNLEKRPMKKQKTLPERRSLNRCTVVACILRWTQRPKSQIQLPSDCSAELQYLLGDQEVSPTGLYLKDASICVDILKNDPEILFALLSEPNTLSELIQNSRDLILDAAVHCYTKNSEQLGLFLGTPGLLLTLRDYSSFISDMALRVLQTSANLNSVIDLPWYAVSEHDLKRVIQATIKFEFVDLLAMLLQHSDESALSTKYEGTASLIRKLMDERFLEDERVVDFCIKWGLKNLAKLNDTQFVTLVADLNERLAKTEEPHSVLRLARILCEVRDDASEVILGLFERVKTWPASCADKTELMRLLVSQTSDYTLLLDLLSHSECVKEIIGRIVSIPEFNLEDIRGKCITKERWIECVYCAFQYQPVLGKLEADDVKEFMAAGDKIPNQLFAFQYLASLNQILLYRRQILEKSMVMAMLDVVSRVVSLFDQPMMHTPVLEDTCLFDLICRALSNVLRLNSAKTFIPTIVAELKQVLDLFRQPTLQHQTAMQAICLDKPADSFQRLMSTLAGPCLRASVRKHGIPFLAYYIRLQNSPTPLIPRIVSQVRLGMFALMEAMTDLEREVTVAMLPDGATRSLFKTFYSRFQTEYKFSG